MTIAVNEALAIVLADLRALPPVGLRAELDKHFDGPISLALREAATFLKSFNMKAPITLIENFVPDHVHSFKTMWNELAWLDVAANRLEYYVNDNGLPYTYGSGNGQRTYEPQMYHSEIMKHRVLLEAHANHGASYGVCFLNGYRDGSDQLGWHADDSPEMDPEFPIAIISFGAKREIYFRPKVSFIMSLNPGMSEEHAKIIQRENVEKVWLNSGSLCLMAAGMQQTHEHRIPKASYICGPRISETFRVYRDV